MLNFILKVLEGKCEEYYVKCNLNEICLLNIMIMEFFCEILGKV